MFDAIKPAVENAVITTSAGSTIKNDWIGDTPEGVIRLINCSTIRGFVTAFAIRLAMKGTPRETITEKINEFLNLCFSSGDLTKDALKWMKDEDWYVRAEYSNNRFNVASCEDDMWRYYLDVIDDATGARTYSSFYSSEMRKQLPENERAILDNYEAAYKAYAEARSIRDAYFSKKADGAVKAMLLKYSDPLQKLDTELYQFMCKRFGLGIQDAEEPVAAPEEEPIGY